VRRLTGPSAAGIHRVSWNLRFPPANPSSLRTGPTLEENPFYEPPTGPLVVPGTYTVSFATRAGGVVTPFGTPQTFEVAPLNLSTLPAADRAELLAFQRKTASLQRAVLGSIETARETETRLGLIKKALDDTPGADPKLAAEARAIDARIKDILIALRGDDVMRRRNRPVPLSISDRVEAIVSSHWTSTSAPTGTNRQAFDIAADEFAVELEKLRTLVEVDLKKLESAMELAGAPWTPGRVPVWKR